MMFYTIYKTTNQLNGKFYIGKHITDDPYDDYLGSNNHLKSAIKKYGQENFIKTILEIYDNEKNMDLAEKILVIIDKDVSYNLNNGGHGGWTYVLRNGLHLHGKRKGQKSPWVIEFNKRTKTGIKLKPEHVEKIRLNSLGNTNVKGKHWKWSKPSPILGKKLSKEIVDQRIGKKRSDEARRNMKLAQNRPEIIAKQKAAHPRKEL